MTRRCLMPVFLALALVAGPALALQPGTAGEEGNFPFEELGLFKGERVSVDVNLQGAMIRLAAALLDTEEPELAELIKGIERIRAQVIESGLEDPSGVRGRMAEGVKWLEERGWSRTFKMSEDDEEVHVYVRDQGDVLVGITVLAFEGDEATAVNIVGTIDPEKFGRFMAAQDFSGVKGFLDD